MNYIIIVSGLPRSGTSMMMGMLQAGGVQILTDHQRQADIDNPRGYYEYEKVKHLKKDNTWLTQHTGKAIKIVSPLLQYLPKNLSYKVIFMNRNLDEVLISQQKMRERQGVIREVGQIDLRFAFEKHLNEIYTNLKTSNNMDVLYLDYDKVIADPVSVIYAVNEFLNLDLPLNIVSSTIRIELYRNRSKAVLNDEV